MEFVYSTVAVELCIASRQYTIIVILHCKSPRGTQYLSRRGEGLGDDLGQKLFYKMTM